MRLRLQPRAGGGRRRPRSAPSRRPSAVIPPAFRHIMRVCVFFVSFLAAFKLPWSCIFYFESAVTVGNTGYFNLPVTCLNKTKEGMFRLCHVRALHIGAAAGCMLSRSRGADRDPAGLSLSRSFRFFGGLSLSRSRGADRFG